MSYPITSIDPTEQMLPEDLRDNEVGAVACEFCGSFSEYYHDHDKECPIYKDGQAMEEGDRRHDEIRDNAL